MSRHGSRANWALAKRYADRIDAKQTLLQSDYSTLPSGYITVDHLAPDVSGYASGLRVLKEGQESGERIVGLDLIQGANVTITIDPPSTDRVSAITIATTGGSGAPVDAEYLVGILNSGLTAERLVTNTTTVAWDLATPGQVKAAVPDDSITYAKLQNISATDTLLGRTSGGAGDPEEIACTAAGRAFLDDATVGAQRATLGLGDASTKNVGTLSGTVCAGDDTRLADARTPIAHAATHKTGGSDVVRLDELATPTASVNFNGQQATSLIIENRTSDPVSPPTGAIWLRTDLP